MRQRLDITDPKSMMILQGDRVIVYKHGINGELIEFHVMTIVRVMGDRQELRLVNRDNKTRKPDWPFTQDWYDSLRKAEENKVRAKWQVTLKS